MLWKSVHIITNRHRDSRDAEEAERLGRTSADRVGENATGLRIFQPP